MKPKCGPGKLAFRLTDFIFEAMCSWHDKKYREGGGLLEKVYADTMFYAYCLKDIKNGNYKFLRKYGYFTVATLYYLIVMTLGWIPWIGSCLKRKFVL